MFHVMRASKKRKGLSSKTILALLKFCDGTFRSLIRIVRAKRKIFWQWKMLDKNKIFNDFRENLLCVIILWKRIGYFVGFCFLKDFANGNTCNWNVWSPCLQRHLERLRKRIIDLEAVALFQWNDLLSDLECFEKVFLYGLQKEKEYNAKCMTNQQV